MLTLAGTKDNVIQTGTVNLHFLVPGTSEPISATVSILVISSHVVSLRERYLVCIDDWRVHLETPGKLTSCERNLAINLPGCFRLLFLLSFLRKTKNAWLKTPTDLLYKNLMKPLTSVVAELGIRPSQTTFSVSLYCGMCHTNSHPSTVSRISPRKGGSLV